MSNKKDTLKTMWKEHKKELLIGAGAVLVGTISGVLCVKGIKAHKKTVKGIDMVTTVVEELPVECVKCGEIVDKPWIEGNVVNMIVNGIKISDLGNFGNGLKETFEDLTDSNSVSAVLCLDGVYKAK